MHFFIMISLLVHVLSVIAIIVLFQKKSLEQNDPIRSEEELNSITSTMEKFIKEIETENEALYERFLRQMYRKEQEWNKRLNAFEKELHHRQENSQSMDRAPEQQKTKINGEQDTYQPNRKTTQRRSAPAHQAESLTIKETKQDMMDENSNIEPSSKGLDEDDHIQKVYELHNQGFSKEHISKVLKLGIGEVSFIVNMLEKYRQKGRS